MIPRYMRPEMLKIWTDENRFRLWLQIELSVCEEMAKQKKISPKDWKALKIAGAKLLKKGISPERVEAQEVKTRHDVLAFTTVVAEELGPLSRYIHYGLTSSDIVDTALSLQVQEAGKVLLKEIEQLLKGLKKKAQTWKKLPTIGRSHGIFAEPTSFGLKFLGWYAEWQRNHVRLKTALENLRVGKLSGAVGVGAHWDPDSESRILGRLGLRREPVSTQVIPRDRHAEFLNTLALCGASMERIAVELRHLQRSEVGEVIEGFMKGQKGSSAMPHKRNPISAENLTGCARLLRSYAQAALENVALWHERDISHSSVERVIFPDATLLLDYSLHRLHHLIDGLAIQKERVDQNLKNASDLSFSGHFLLALVQKGISREDAYVWVQQCAIEALEKKKDFLDLLIKHPEVKKILPAKEIKKLGSLAYQLRSVPRIFEGVLKGD